MEFTTQTPNPPKNLYPCLATITIVPHGTDTKRRTSSFGSNSGDEGLSRVISGGRRKTSFGVVADRGDHAGAARRRSFGAQGGVPSGSALGSGDEISGKWYWRVQAGTTDHQLILLPLSNPPNPVLTTRPQPLSHAMPAHSKEHGGGDGHTGHTEEHEGIGTKIKNLFRKSSTTHDDRHDTSNTAHGQVADHNDTTSGTASTTATAVDRVIDQTPQGEMLPSTNANAHGATNLNANAETGYPGMINGQHLGAIIVDLRNVDKSKVSLGLGKKNEGSTVTVHVSGGHGINPVGSNHHDSPKSGTIKFEFDKDWIGAKGEAELLHHYITTAIDNYAGGGGHFPQSTNFQLGGGNTTGNNGSGVTGGATGTTGPFSGTSGNTFGGAHTGQNFQHTQGNPLGNEVAPDHRVAT